MVLCCWVQEGGVAALRVLRRANEVILPTDKGEGGGGGQTRKEERNRGTFFSSSPTSKEVEPERPLS
jgi:hypothetical protein